MTEAAANRLYGPLMQTIESYEETIGRVYRENVARVARENDAALRERLKTKFAVPDALMDTAVGIWWDGKED